VAARRSLRAAQAMRSGDLRISLFHCGFYAQNLVDFERRGCVSGCLTSFVAFTRTI